MSKFSTKATTKTTNLAGGQAYTQSKEVELLSILLTSFGTDKYYQSEGEIYNRLATLCNSVNPVFACKAIVYARTKFGMRSVTHIAASLIASRIVGQSYASSFYNGVVYRPDDMYEIIACHLGRKQKITNSMKKGFARAFDKFDAYSLGKYRGEGKRVNLVDVVNLVHPVPVENNAQAIADLVGGKLKSFDTWEVELTKAGGDLKKKAKAWHKLISERKIGYFALLRNLRNITEQANAATVKTSLEMLRDEKLIKKSLVLPFRYLTAIEQFAHSSSKYSRDIIEAINDAAELSLSNVPVFEGKTLIALDVSGSMTWGHQKQSPAEIGGMFASAIYKTNDCDFMGFDNRSQYQNFNPNDSLITISKSIDYRGGGTDFNCIFNSANKAYERIIILSDMQAWEGYRVPKNAHAEYKKSFECDPLIYSFDLQGYGTMQFPEQNVYALAGFSEKTLDIMKFLESDKNALVNEVNKIEL